MQTYYLKLQAEMSQSFNAILAAQSLDINVAEKSIHEIKITADLQSPFNVGVIVGSSGSGKTTLAKKIFGEDCFKVYLDDSKALIDQFPESFSYEERASVLNGIGLTSVPCWLRPVRTLSNGQRARAEAALALSAPGPGIIILDEWTSVVDRTVAKVMSHCVQKFARRVNKQVILLACHHDILDWLDPDFIIDCNTQSYIDRRSLPRGQRGERLTFDVREVSKDSWRYFSKYHYLSQKLPGGKVFFYGLFYGQDQIGFLCFANYIPIRPGSTPIFHSNRAVVHPDYAGMGLGLKFINAACAHLKSKIKCELRATFSSAPLYRARLKDQEHWILLKVDRKIGRHKALGNGNFSRGQSVRNNPNAKGGFRENVKVYTFKFR